jgi:hypothetical protein
MLILPPTTLCTPNRSDLQEIKFRLSLRLLAEEAGARQIAVLLHKFRLTLDDQIYDDLLN